jgi:DNA-binding cell septation regulator SpoVG
VSRAIERLRHAIEFLDMVRDTPAHEMPEGVMRDALHGLEEAAREAVKDHAVTAYYTDRANGCHANRAT